MNLLSQREIQIYFKTYQKKLRLGDKLPSLVSIAEISGIHRDTIYAIIAGDRINHRSQYALSKAIQEVELQITNLSKTRIMSVDLTAAGPKLSFGINKLNIFR